MFAVGANEISQRSNKNEPENDMSSRYCLDSWCLLSFADCTCQYAGVDGESAVGSHKHIW